MLFTEPRFFLFFAVVFALAWTARRNRRRKAILLAASYLFYAAWDPRFLSLIVASTLVDHWAAKRIAASEETAPRRRWLALSLSVNLGILGFFKYFDFFVESASAFLTALGAPEADRALGIILPVGISFFTFQTLSYTIDVYRGRIQPNRSLADFALFVGFFPQLVAGPIVRAADFLPQLARAPRWASVEARLYVGRFLSGFIKKAVIADSIAPRIDQVFSAPAAHDSLAVWVAVLLYSIQIYCDFSGYTDMAIACAGLLGYRLAVNFDFPYLAHSLADFWRRWHISLSGWLRDYLYIPLGGSRGGRWKTLRNLTVTMLLGGLWHGAAWTFVAWGALHGAGLGVQREWSRRGGKLPAARVLGPSLTFVFVATAWVLFRAQSFADAAVLLRAFLLFDAAGSASLSPWHLLWPVALLPIHVLAASGAPRRWLEGLPGWTVSPLYGAVSALALAFVPMRSEPFIYFQF